MEQTFHVTLLTHEDGVSVSCPELPGCHSQGSSVDEALENIEDAIRGYLALYGAPEYALRNSRNGSGDGLTHQCRSCPA